VLRLRERPLPLRPPLPGAAMTKISLTTENKQTLVVQKTDDGMLILRIQKDGHNRGIAYLSPASIDALAEFIQE